MNLAAYLLMDGWKDRYDAALIVSQDTDLCEPLRMVRDELRKSVGIVWLDGTRPGRRFRSCSSFVRQTTSARLRSAQFPDIMTDRRGRPLRKPSSWGLGDHASDGGEEGS